MTTEIQIQAYRKIRSSAPFFFFHTGETKFLNLQNNIIEGQNNLNLTPTSTFLGSTADTFAVYGWFKRNSESNSFIFRMSDYQADQV